MFRFLGQVVMNISVVLPAAGDGVWRRNGALLYLIHLMSISPLCLPKGHHQCLSTPPFSHVLQSQFYQDSVEISDCGPTSAIVFSETTKEPQ